MALSILLRRRKVFKLKMYISISLQAIVCTRGFGCSVHFQNFNVLMKKALYNKIKFLCTLFKYMIGYFSQCSGEFRTILKVWFVVNLYGHRLLQECVLFFGPMPQVSCGSYLIYYPRFLSLRIFEPKLGFAVERGGGDLLCGL